MLCRLWLVMKYEVRGMKYEGHVFSDFLLLTSYFVIQANCF
jgi:hypothetical protein